MKSRKYKCGKNSVVINHVITLPCQQLPAAQKMKFYINSLNAKLPSYRN